MDEKEFCGTIEMNENIYDVYRYPIDSSVVVSNRKKPNGFTNAGGHAKNCEAAVEVAKNMINSNPGVFD